MKSVLISIQPKWCELIASGKKTVEIRETRPKIETPFKCYVYCTKNRDMLWVLKKSERIYTDKIASIINAKDVGGATKVNGKVIGEFVCDKVYDFVQFGAGIVIVDPLADFELIEKQEVLNMTCLTEEQICDYIGNKDGYAWHISDLVIYDKPKELNKCRTLCKGQYEDCRKCGYFHSEGCESTGFFESCCFDGVIPLTRPPQSWCYVEELKGGAE